MLSHCTMMFLEYVKSLTKHCCLTVYRAITTMLLKYVKSLTKHCCLTVYRAIAMMFLKYVKSLTKHCCLTVYRAITMMFLKHVANSYYCYISSTETRLRFRKPENEVNMTLTNFVCRKYKWWKITYNMYLPFMFWSISTLENQSTVVLKVSSDNKTSHNYGVAVYEF